jgi:hypothetical protein
VSLSLLHQSIPFLADCDKESSTPRGTIVPLKRTLQERVVEKESCYFCG